MKGSTESATARETAATKERVEAALRKQKI